MGAGRWDILGEFVAVAGVAAAGHRNAPLDAAVALFYVTGSLQTVTGEVL